MTQRRQLSEEERKQLEAMRDALNEMLSGAEPADRQRDAVRLRHLAMDAGVLARHLGQSYRRESIPSDSTGRRRAGWTKWNTLSAGDRVIVRSKRGAAREDEVTIQEILAHDVDGAGFLGDDGKTYRRFYFDVAHVVEDP